MSYFCFSQILTDTVKVMCKFRKNIHMKNTLVPYHNEIRGKKNNVANFYLS